MLNPQDPVAMHLLMEHALGESRQFQVFSVEEIDELKKESATLSSRIEATRKKLTIEGKIRDAAASIDRLDPHGGKENLADSASRQHRRNLLSKGSGGSIRNRSDDEVTASIQKCEDLLQELWKMEKRSQEVQRLLLEHTAGVLQMTHKGALEKDGERVLELSGYSNGYSDPDLLDLQFDDRSFYHTLDAMLDPSAQVGDTAAFKHQTQAILDTQHRLRDLNQRLRDAISQASSGKSTVPLPPEPDMSSGIGAEDVLLDQIQYMEHGLETLQSSQTEIAHELEKMENATEKRLESLSQHLREVVLEGGQDSGMEVPQPPQVSGYGSDAQITFLEGGLNALEQNLRRLQKSAHTSHTRSLSHEERMGQYESTFQDLWHKMVAEEEASRVVDEQSGSVPKEKFSIEAFASKVNLLNTRTANLAQQKDILSRQIQQQREINSKSDSERDARLLSVTQELEQAKRDLEARDNDFEDQLAAAKTLHSQNQQEMQQNHNDTHAQLATARSAHAQIQQEMQRNQDDFQAHIAAARAAHAEVQQEMQQKDNDFQAQIAAERSAHAEVQQAIQQKDSDFQAQLATARLAHAQVQQEMQQKESDYQAQLAMVRSAHAQMQEELQQKDSDHDAQLSNVKTTQAQMQEELQQRDSDYHAQLENAKTAHMQIQQDMQQRDKDYQAQLASARTAQAQLQQELESYKEQHAGLQEIAESRAIEAERAHQEMQELEGEMVRLQTELTVSRAELDGAYGTRAQRAAEVAQHPALTAEVAGLKEELAAVKNSHGNASTDNAELTERVQTLQRELSETIGEYEVMTKSSIEFERERENLESTVDGLRDKIESLETELGDEKVQRMGVKSPGVAGDRNSNEKGATSTSVLRTEFKKMMRETRAEHMKMLRVSLSVEKILNRSNFRAARTRGKTQARGANSSPKERPDPWKVIPEPKHDGSMIKEQFHKSFLKVALIILERNTSTAAITHN